MLGFWGKLEQDADGKVLAWLPLASHCADVAHVFRALCRKPLLESRLKAAAGSALSPAQLDRLAVIVLLHDLGKANLGFQDRPHSGRRIGHIQPIRLLVADRALCYRFAAAIELPLLQTWFDPAGGTDEMLIAAWSHHGLPIRFDPHDFSGLDARWWHSTPDRDPFEAIAALMKCARTEFPRAFDPTVPALPAPAALQHRFAGLVMLADWLGSHTAFFPINRHRGFSSRQAARDAVGAVGLDPKAWQFRLMQRNISLQDIAQFPRLTPMQAALDSLPVDRPELQVLFAEAETGSGKTEAALARFFRLFAARKVDSLYFALPTRVAAREIYTRICTYIERAFPEPSCRPHVVLAVPGYAQVDREPIERILPGESRWAEDSQNLHRWAAEHPKRFLAATIAVGTIDQALLSAIQSRHAHLRSVCLNRSLLVVDEVHASDVYMRSLLAGLLKHHVELGGHALLLSATLGSTARTELLAAAGLSVPTPAYAAALNVAYPALISRDGAVHSMAPGELVGKRVSIRLLPALERLELVVPEVVAALTDGARILVILNTVNRVIALQQLLERAVGVGSEALFRCRGVVCPHHGRFAPSDRELLDQAVTADWGKSSPSGPRVLVGTQTLEQSLDIDSDFMITDLCPADVLLQRVGRLQRHQRVRPSGFTLAQCVVLVPAGQDTEDLLDEMGRPLGRASAAGLGSVYPDLRTIERTRRVLEQHPVIDTPSDNRLLVEGATHTELLDAFAGERWQLHTQKVVGAFGAERIAAYYAAAAYGTRFGETTFNDIANHPQARTRLGLGALRYTLEPPVPGPFGAEVREIIIPESMLRGGTPAQAIEDITQTADGFRFRLGVLRFRYTRFGLEREDV